MYKDNVDGLWHVNYSPIRTKQKIDKKNSKHKNNMKWKKTLSKWYRKVSEGILKYILARYVASGRNKMTLRIEILRGRDLLKQVIYEENAYNNTFCLLPRKK